MLGNLAIVEKPENHTNISISMKNSIACLNVIGKVQKGSREQAHQEISEVNVAMNTRTKLLTGWRSCGSVTPLCGSDVSDPVHARRFKKNVLPSE